MSTTTIVAIIGGGKMASNIVEYLIQYDLSIVWYIRSSAVLDEKKSRIKKKISRLLQVGSNDQDYVIKKQDCVRFTNNLEDVCDVDIIIECVSENVESKRDVFDRLQGTRALVFTNTSSLPLDSFIPDTMMWQSAGLHFFYPVQLKQFVELNVHEKTNAQVLDKMVQFVREIGKQVLVLKEEHHFILNRMFLTYLAQSCCAVQMYNISPDRFDIEIGKYLFPIGPFTFMKSVGFDIMSKSVDMYSLKSKDPAFYKSLLQLLQNANGYGDLVTGGNPAAGDSELVEKAAFEVKTVFVNMVYHELAAHYVDNNQLLDALADYAGVTRDALDIVLYNVTPEMPEALRRLYNATYWNVYRPSMQLLKSIRKLEPEV